MTKQIRKATISKLGGRDRRLHRPSACKSENGAVEYKIIASKKEPVPGQPDHRVQINGLVPSEFRDRVKADAKHMGRDIGAQLVAAYRLRDRTALPDLDRLIGRIGGRLAGLALSDAQRAELDGDFAQMIDLARRIIR